jgi:hypothetical protein
MSTAPLIAIVESAAGDKQPNTRIVLVTAAGAILPAVLLPALPTADGNYNLTVASGAYSWSAVV